MTRGRGNIYEGIRKKNEYQNLFGHATKQDEQGDLVLDAEKDFMNC